MLRHVLYWYRFIMINIYKILTEELQRFFFNKQFLADKYWSTDWLGDIDIVLLWQHFRTLTGFLCFMKFDVFFKFCPFFELPLAELALVKRLFVYTPHMAVQITFWSKQGRAKVALVGFLARVNPHVHFESRCRCTLLGAELARKLVLPSVHQDVIVVLGLLGKPERTELTLERAQVWPTTLYIIILHRQYLLEQRKEVFFYKRTIKLCFRCSWQCPRTSAP